MSRRLLHIIRAYAMAGAEKHVFMLLPALKQRGYEPTLLTLTDGAPGRFSDDYGEGLAALRTAGVRVVESWVSGKLDLRALARVRAVLRETCPDLVHTHMAFSDVTGGLAARLQRVPRVVSTRHYDYSHGTGALLKSVAFHRATKILQDAVIAISPRVVSLCRKYEGWSPASVHLIMHGCADEEVDKAAACESVRRELDVPDGDLLVGTVARLIGWKGHRYALDALAQLKPSGTRVTWLFVGSGAGRDNLLSQARRLGVEQSVRFLGHRTDVPRLAAAFDVMVHPAIAEGFGLIFLEAMMQSTPIVASSAGAMPDIIDDGTTGLLVPPGQSKDIAAALARLAADHKLRTRLGDAGRKRFEAEFTLERMVDQTTAVYDRVSGWT